MNTLKEALQKIVNMTFPVSDNDALFKFSQMKNLATEALKEQTSEPSPSVEEKAEKEYPVKMEHYSNGIPNGMYGMCDSNYYSREAFIKGHQSALDSIEQWAKSHNYGQERVIFLKDLLPFIESLKTNS